METSVHLAPEIEQRLDVLAGKTGLSKTDLLNHIIKNGLEDVEDYYEAVETLERVRNGQEAVYTEAEVMAHLGLDH